MLLLGWQRCSPDGGRAPQEGKVLPGPGMLHRVLCCSCSSGSCCRRGCVTMGQPGSAPRWPEGLCGARGSVEAPAPACPFLPCASAGTGDGHRASGSRGSWWPAALPCGRRSRDQRGWGLRAVPLCWAGPGHGVLGGWGAEQSWLWHRWTCLAALRTRARAAAGFLAYPCTAGSKQGQRPPLQRAVPGLRAHPGGARRVCPVVGVTSPGQGMDVGTGHTAP